MNDTLPFAHTIFPFCDFIVYARKRNSLASDSARLENGLRSIGFVQRSLGSYGNIEAAVAHSVKLPTLARNFIFSGYLQRQGKMYVGQVKHPGEYFAAVIYGATDIATETVHYWLKGVRKN